MASIGKYRDGWRAQIFRAGVRKSKTFRTRREAQAWAARQEYLIDNRDRLAASQPFGEVLDRYAREVSPGKRGHRWEVVRLERFKADPIAKIGMADLSAADLAAWRDRRLREVAPGTVRREMGLLGAVLAQARKEWGLLRDNPMGDVRKPSEPPARDRLPTPEEMERLAHAAGDDLSTATARAFHAFRFACETAMRAGEIVGLTWERVDLGKRVAHLPRTKNGTARDVPLSSAAVDLLRALPQLDPVFGLTSRQLDALWRKLRERAAVDGLRFHDSRHFATVSLAKKVDVLDLARILGHKNLRELMTYYNEPAERIAKRLG